MFQLFYELRKNCCGTGGRDGEIEGSTRGPRGPKKKNKKDISMIGEKTKRSMDTGNPFLSLFLGKFDL